MKIKASLFDLHGTLLYPKQTVTSEQASDLLVKCGYEIYPQALEATWHFVSMIDYPKYGFKTWDTWLRRVLYRLGVRADKGTIEKWKRLSHNYRWAVYADARPALLRAKKLGLKTAVVTTIAKFMYQKALEPTRDKIDLLADGFTFNCEKSNPRIYQNTLEYLSVKPTEAVMIGDEPYVDVTIPKKLGMRAILLNRTPAKQSRIKVQPDATVKNLNQALKLIEEWIQ